MLHLQPQLGICYRDGKAGIEVSLINVGGCDLQFIRHFSATSQPQENLVTNNPGALHELRDVTSSRPVQFPMYVTIVNFIVPIL